MANVPQLTTERLLLREFTKQDAEAVLQIFSDKEVNTFLPMFPLKMLAEAEHLIQAYQDTSTKGALHYAICLQPDNIPIGYVNVSAGASHDFGYGLRKEFWHKGIMTEACLAVIALLKQSGIPFITATHDRNNPRSGNVMKKLGMVYQYSYEEQWQPKDFLVTFRMYQLNFTMPPDFVYPYYWDISSVHYIEAGF